MSRSDIINFMQTYQRITQNMFKDAPKYASIVMKLNSNHQINSRPDVIIFEGWCVGAKAQKNSELVRSINSLEKTQDPNLVWRKYVNIQLKTHYKNLFKQLNETIYLRANNFRVLQKWRIKQEKVLLLKLKNKKNLKIMNRNDIINFMQTYQRITQSMFKDVPKYASIVMKLNSNHQINSIKFR